MGKKQDVVNENNYHYNNYKIIYILYIFYLNEF